MPFLKWIHTYSLSKYLPTHYKVRQNSVLISFLYLLFLIYLQLITCLLDVGHVRYEHFSSVYCLKRVRYITAYKFADISDRTTIISKSQNFSISYQQSSFKSSRDTVVGLFGVISLSLCLEDIIDDDIMKQITKPQHNAFFMSCEKLMAKLF